MFSLPSPAPTLVGGAIVAVRGWPSPPFAADELPPEVVVLDPPHAAATIARVDASAPKTAHTRDLCPLMIHPSLPAPARGPRRARPRRRSPLPGLSRMCPPAAKPAGSPFPAA